MKITIYIRMHVYMYVFMYAHTHTIMSRSFPCLFLLLRSMVYLFGESSHGCKQEIPNSKPNLQIISELGKLCSLMFGKFNIFLPKSQNTRLPFTRISVQIVCSSEVPYFRITGSF